MGYRMAPILVGYRIPNWQRVLCLSPAINLVESTSLAGIVMREGQPITVFPPTLNSVGYSYLFLYMADVSHIHFTFIQLVMESYCQRISAIRIAYEVEYVFQPVLMNKICPSTVLFQNKDQIEAVRITFIIISLNDSLIC